MHCAASLRRELSARNQQIASDSGISHELTSGETPSVIFGRTGDQEHGNFHPISYRNICANPSWMRRLGKVHTASRRAFPRTDRRWMELDCANSSDALLMNIFCYSRAIYNSRLSALLGIAPGLTPEFGFKPGIPLCNGKVDRTEIDLRLGNLLIEAKLTETDFQKAPIRLLQRYRDIDEVFDFDGLERVGDIVSNYQLIRGVLAAYATAGSFCVFCDARRVDLIENWYSVMLKVRSCAVRCRLQLLTWQELAGVMPKILQKFLAMKYGLKT
jgi:hypothetical protein